MKKILAALLVLALGMPTLAATAITATDAGSQQLLISFSGPENAVRGVALTVTVTNGTIESGAFISSSFNTFVDYAFYTAQAGYTGPDYAISMGHPFALESAPGVATFPISEDTAFAISVGYLDQNSTKLGLTSGSVALIQISNIPNNESATVTFSANATRGGAAVGDTLGDVTVQPQVLVAGPVTTPTDKTLAMSAGANGTLVEDKSGTYPVGTPVAIGAIANTNYKFAGWTPTANIADPAAASTTITMNADATIVATFAPKTCYERLTPGLQQTLYTRYVTAGKDPSSWCWQFQCWGDADGLEQGSLVKYRVASNDLQILLNSWNKRPETGADPRADFDHAEQGSLVKYSTASNDLQILLNNWNKKTSQLTNCATYLP